LTRVRNVILLPHGFQPEYEAGFANGLARNGWSVALIGSDMSLVDRLDQGVQLLNLRRSQDSGRPRWRKALNMLGYWQRSYRYVLRHRGTPVHVIGDFATADLRISLIEGWLTRLLAGRYVLTVHNPTRGSEIRSPPDRRTMRNFRLNRAIYRTAEVCVVHTSRMRDALAELDVDPTRIVVVEHGIDRLLPATEASRRAMRNRLGVREDEKLLLFFGNLAPYKGLDILLQAFDRLAGRLPVRLVIAGRSTGSLKAEIGRQIEGSPYRAAIQWLDGYFPEDEVASLFHGADVFVMPYRHIDQSGALFMALATGLRVVASDVGSLRDYIPPEVGKVVPPCDVPALTHGIETVLSEPQPARLPAGMAARLLWSSTVQPVLPVYERLSGG
jgi:glycosyltransferase involved in cell wall biosynthesis